MYAAVKTIRGGERLHLALDGTALRPRSSESQFWMSTSLADGRSRLAALAQTNSARR